MWEQPTQSETLPHAAITSALLPVILSMQTFVVLAIGVAYGSHLGGVTVLTYLVEGASGLPVLITALRQSDAR